MALPAGRPARLVDQQQLEDVTRAHLPLVHRNVARVIGRIPRSPQDDDLVAAAMMGLVQAAIAFDPTRNVSFGAFATLRIKGAVLDELRRIDWASRPVRARAKRMEAATERLTAALGRVPTDRELAADLGLHESDLRELVGQVHRALVLSMTTQESDDEEALQCGEPDPLEQVISLEERRAVRRALSTLSERHHRVVVGYYYDGLTMRELGDELGVTESRVCQLCAEAVDRLRLQVLGPSGQRA